MTKFGGWEVFLYDMPERYYTLLPKTQPSPIRGKPMWGTAEVNKNNVEDIYCSNHGAMNKVSFDMLWWRCLRCNLGIEYNASGNASQECCSSA